MPHATIGVIGGSGLYRMESMIDVEEIAIQTPFGDPSDVVTIGKVEGVSMAFLPRHGRGHTISPTEIPVRANIWALKSLGVEWVISVSAVGSLREHIAPRDLVIPNQLFDRTKSRVNSFFEGGIVVHCPFADPFCSTLSHLLLESAHELRDVKVHEGGNYVCWHESEESVTVELVLSNLSANVANAQRILRSVARKIPADRSANTCSCPHALAAAILTDRSRIPAEAKEKYSLLVGKYLS